MLKCEWCWGENFIHTYQMGYESVCGGSLRELSEYRNQAETDAALHHGTEVSQGNAEGFHDAKTEHDLDQPDCKKQRGMCDPTGYFCGYASEQRKGTGGKYFYG